MDNYLEKYIGKIRGFYSDNSVMPTYREMTELFGFKSKNAVFKLVNKLVAEEYISKDGLGRLVPSQKFLGGVKILGAVEAGFPTPAEEDLAETMSIDHYLIANRDASFMLRVSGESMIDAGIHEGDMLIVERRNDCKNGEIVVAFIDGGYTVKYFRKQGNKVWLEPANKKFKRIVPSDDEELKIMAVVKAVIRKY